MRGGRLSTARIAVNNIMHRRFRSVCIALLTALTALLITGGTWLGFSLRNGVDSINARLGADAMVIPEVAADSFEGALLSGSPSTFYMTSDTANRVTQLDGIARATRQLFISTFDSEHCAALVQIIGYEPDTDFVVAPWLKSSDVTAPGLGEVVIGSGIELKIGQQMPIFAVQLDVVGALEKTGMGFDNSIFVTMDTAKMLLGEYEKYSGALPLPEGTDIDHVFSTILLDIKGDADPVSVQKSINTGFRSDGIRYVSSQSLLASTSKNLNLVTGVLTVLLAAVWVFAVFVLAIIFTLALNERQREFGILRAIGATRQKLTAIVLSEAAILCAVGAVVGVGLVSLIVFPYGPLIERTMQTAYLPPQSAATAAILGACLILGAVVGPLAALFSVARIGKSDAFANMQEGQ